MLLRCIILILMDLLSIHFGHKAIINVNGDGIHHNNGMMYGKHLIILVYR